MAKAKTPVVDIPKEITIVNGIPGIWNRTGEGKFIQVKNLITGETKTVKALPGFDGKGGTGTLREYYIIQNGNKALMMPQVFTKLYELEISDNPMKEFIDVSKFKNQSIEKQGLFMGEVVKGYDEEAFKHFHMIKILKWWIDYKNSEIGKKFIEGYHEMKKAWDDANNQPADEVSKTEPKVDENEIAATASEQDING